MSAYYNSADGQQPQGVVIVNTATGAATTPLTDAQLRATAIQVSATVLDSTGQPFNLDACTHVYARNILGRPLTDTATDGASTWVKTYSYDASNNLVGKTGWVKQ